MEPIRAQNSCTSKRSNCVSGIGEFLREIMPSWLNRPAGRSSTRYARGHGTDDARKLAREADAVWQQHVDQGLHCEAFPEPVPGPTRKRDEGGKREKPSGSNGLH
jgi:hypothetical protein